MMNTRPLLALGVAALVAYAAHRVMRGGPGAPGYGPAIWIPATRFRPGRRQRPTIIIIHCTETDLGPAAARKVANTWAAADSPATSCHYVVDATEVVQCVRETDEGWCAAETGNREGIHVELVGRWAETDWLGEGWPVVQRAARLVHDIAHRWNIPLVRLGVSELRAGLPGITTHAQVSAAWGESDHVDPGGPNDERWPWAKFLEAAA